MSKPVAVLISDIHFNINTLDVATKALQQAVDKANALGVVLVLAGDTHDSKANLRGECVSSILDTLDSCYRQPIVLVGNHCLINERSEENAIEFLRSTAVLIKKPEYIESIDSWCLPYYSNADQLRQVLHTTPKGRRIIMHQGLNGSESGEYIQDKSALNYEDVADFRVISGHYHKRQDIKTGHPQKGAVGLFSYIGNPYTLGFGEAKDPEKGYQILMQDGTLEWVPTNLRRHHIYEIDYKDIGKRPTIAYNSEDLLLVKVKGSREDLSKVDKQKLSMDLSIRLPSYRLDLIPIDSEISTPESHKNMTSGELLDSMIDSLSNTSDEQKTRLKELWKKLCVS